MNKVQDHSRLIDPASFPPVFKKFYSHWTALGISLAVRCIDNKFRLPCFQAFIMEEESDTVNLSTGQGLHADPHIALSRAICEAAQSRLSHIHGGRDDVVHFYAKYARWNKTDRVRVEDEVKLRAFSSDGMKNFNEVVVSCRNWMNCSAWSLPEMIARLKQCLTLQGLGPIYRYEFRHAIPGVSVVKVIVAKAEHVEHNLKRMGPRMFAAVTGNA